jgi:replicative DNA helicase
VKDWVRIVKAKSLQRQLLTVCQAAINKAYDGGSGFTIISVLRDNLDEIESSAKRGIRP